MSTVTANDAVAGLLDVLARGPVLVRVDALAGLLDVAEFDVEQIVAEAVERGVAELWSEAPPGPCVVLSTNEANGRNLVIVSPADDPAAGRWRRADEWVREPRGRRERRRKHKETPTEGLDEVVDPRAPGHLELLELLELAETARLAAQDRGRRASRERTLDALAKSVLTLIGLRHAWSARPRKPGEPCPGCGGRPLAVWEVCLDLWCGRAGFDHLLGPLPRVRTALPTPDGLAGGKGRASGKAKSNGKASRHTPR
jgi:hypothetical protein